MRSMGGGIVICGYSLPDMTADDLCYDIGGAGEVIAVAQASMLDLCENEYIHKIASPLKKNELIYMVRLLLEMEEKRISAFKNTRSDEDKKTIFEAKKLLMGEMGISEDEAHKYIQKMSMDMRVRFSVAAEQIINKYVQ